MNRNESRRYFSEDELAQIRRSVESAESGTSGEISTMVVDQSDFYLEAELLGSVLSASLVAFAVALVSHHIAIWSYVPMVFLLYFPCRFIFERFPYLKLPFVSKRRMVHAVRDRAVRAFYEKGLYKTRGETGVLIFISLLERKVWILGDRGINARIAPHQWHEMAGRLARGIKEGRGAEALCSVVAECGAELAAHFPRRSDDVNELIDEVIR